MSCQASPTLIEASLIQLGVIIFHTHGCVVLKRVSSKFENLTEYRQQRVINYLFDGLITFISAWVSTYMYAKYADNTFVIYSDQIPCAEIRAVTFIVWAYVCLALVELAFMENTWDMWLHHILLVYAGAKLAQDFKRDPISSLLYLLAVGVSWMFPHKFMFMMYHFDHQNLKAGYYIFLFRLYYQGALSLVFFFVIPMYAIIANWNKMDASLKTTLFIPFLGESLVEVVILSRLIYPIMVKKRQQYYDSLAKELTTATEDEKPVKPDVINLEVIERALARGLSRDVTDDDPEGERFLHMLKKANQTHNALESEAISLTIQDLLDSNNVN